jgi:hypothetical protein
MLRAEKQEDLYKILGITKKADQSEVKTVFRKLALKWHPDKNDSPEAKETFQKISMAYSSKPFSPPQKKIRPLTTNLLPNSHPPFSSHSKTPPHPPHRFF